MLGELKLTTPCGCSLVTPADQEDLKARAHAVWPGEGVEQRAKQAVDDLREQVESIVTQAGEV
eukprot:4761305-Pyramimonas_sp.AAC.1